jgi:hypothetical protein
VRKEFAEAV